MNLECPHCRAEVRIDPARLPSGRTARVACPHCRQIFPLPVMGGGVTGPPRPSAAAGPGAPTPENEAWLRQQLEALRVQIKAELTAGLPAVPVAGPTPHAGPAGRVADPPTALVAAGDPAVQVAAVQAFTRMGYQPRKAVDLAGAVQALDEEALVMVVVDQSLGGADAEGPKLLEWANRMPGVRRRGIFVAWVADDVRSLDQGAAFVCGANATVARADLPRLSDVLRDGLIERDKLYRVFNEVMASVRG